MTPVGVETTISAGEWPQTYAIDRAATGTGPTICSSFNNKEESTLRLFSYILIK